MIGVKENEQRQVISMSEYFIVIILFSAASSTSFLATAPYKFSTMV